MSTKKKVLVAMSGGVDSSVSALLLKKQGFDVTGIGLKLIDNNLQQICDSTGSCCGKEGFKHAKDVAGKIGIPFFILDVSKQFRDKILNYFINSYLSGYTPNPCIVCNKKIKFDILIKHADSLGINYIATGHYAIIKQNNTDFSLLKAKDTKKDQSYFLCTLNQKYLERLLFPVGKFLKSDIRNIAKKHYLPVHDKKDSQDICFLKEGSYADFLKNFIQESGKAEKPGPIINKDGKKIGTHKGFIKYTIGQRRGLGISNPKPLYVSKILPEENTIVARTKNEIYQSEAKVKGLSWVNAEPRYKNFKAGVQIRYNHKPARADITIKNDKAIIKFIKPQWAIAPGQAASFYKNDRLIGCGWIMKQNEN